MKHLIRQVFHSPKFMVGFIIFMAMLLMVLIYPLIITGRPLAILSQGTFLPPGIYVSVYDSIEATNRYTLKLNDAAAKRIASKLGDDDRLAMQEWLLAVGVPENEIDLQDTAKLLELWANYYDPAAKISGMTNAKRNYFIRLNNSLDGLLSTEGAIIAVNDPDTGTLVEKKVVSQTDYVNVREVPNVRLLPLGTDNFGRDVLTELVSATGTSLVIGFVAGTIATLIGLTLGLIGGYIGDIVDDGIMFFTNLFTVFVQHRAGKTWCCHDRNRDWFNHLGMDCQSSAGAGDFPSQSRPC